LWAFLELLDVRATANQPAARRGAAVDDRVGIDANDLADGTQNFFADERLAPAQLVQVVT
jgi:hypothetical protein